MLTFLSPLPTPSFASKILAGYSITAQTIVMNTVEKQVWNLSQLFNGNKDHNIVSH